MEKLNIKTGEEIEKDADAEETEDEDEDESVYGLSTSSDELMNDDWMNHQDQRLQEQLPQVLQWLAEPNSTPREVRLVHECQKQIGVSAKLRTRLNLAGQETMLFKQLMEQLEQGGAANGQGTPREAGDREQTPLEQVKQLVREAAAMKQSLEQTRREQQWSQSVATQGDERDQESKEHATMVAQLQSMVNALQENEQGHKIKAMQQEDHIRMLYQTVSDLNTQQTETILGFQREIKFRDGEIGKYKSIVEGVHGIVQSRHDSTTLQSPVHAPTLPTSVSIPETPCRYTHGFPHSPRSGA